MRQVLYNGADFVVSLRTARTNSELCDVHFVTPTLAHFASEAMRAAPPRGPSTPSPATGARRTGTANV